ncbi:UDP-3-O-(3-hydroxymyristoyl)glucosamine N-acyltransferase [compost metagenome]
MINAQVIKDLNSSDVTFVSGSVESVATQVLPPDLAKADALIFVSKADQLEAALTAQAPIIVAHKSISLPSDSKATLFQTGSIQMAMAVILPLFDGKMNRFNQEEKIHPQSFVHPTAHLGKNVCIGPFAVIGEHVVIGDGATIAAGTVVESFSKVGEHTLLHSHVFVGSHTEIGAHCEIHPHSTLGADGFAFTPPSKTGDLLKIPQLGRVVIGNHVEIGANCAIDRAALTETRIGNGTKFDNFCHVAHNVVIGEHCVFAAGFKVAGSSHLGNYIMAGGDVSISDHITICDRVIIAGRSGVTNDITVAGQYGGYPLEPLRDSLKTLANKKQLSRIRKNLAQVMKHLNLNDE